jgi:hypothetical protein
LTVLFSHIQKICRFQPIIIFIEVPEEDFLSKVKKFAITAGITYSFVDSKDTAVEVRASMRSQTTGIIVLTTPFARGYDLKLTVDAKVYIVANGNKLKQSDVL